MCEVDQVIGARRGGEVKDLTCDLVINSLVGSSPWTLRGVGVRRAKERVGHVGREATESITSKEINMGNR